LYQSPPPEYFNRASLTALEDFAPCAAASDAKAAAVMKINAQMNRDFIP